MADLTQNVSNTVNCFGPAPTYYNDGEWGTGYWGEGSEDLDCAIGKFLGNSITGSPVIIRDLGKQFTTTFTIDGEFTTSEVVGDGTWNYVFPPPSTNAEDRPGTVWTEV